MKRIAHALFTGLFTFASIPAPRAAVSGPSDFGKTKDGKPVRIYTLSNGKGMTAKISTLGATLVELHVPDKDGKTADVVLGFDGASGYQGEGNQYFGCTTGRVCNRIANGRFTLDGKEYELAVNNGPNHLHGGVERSLDKVLWEATPMKPETGGDGLRLTYISPDGEEGYPGTLKLTVIYALSSDRNALRITYLARTDKRTPVNLTNHSYFNLAGAGAETVLDHLLKINATHHTPTDDTLIPTGKIAPVKGLPIDFTKMTKVGARIARLDDAPETGYDHNFVIDRKEGEKLALAAVLREPKSGRTLTIRTTEPGIQLYTGNFLNGQACKGGKTYPRRSAICLETQHHPDSINHPEFPGVVLEPGRQFLSTTIYAFTAK
jgi:aldose 1-epimerase